MSALDRFLRWKDGIFEFSHDADCIFRIGLAEAARTMKLPERQIPAGAKVIGLHLWNERLPPLPGTGPDMGWAVQVARRATASCRLLARHLLDDPRLAGVQAITGATVLFFPGDRSGAEKLFARLGFTAVPYESAWGHFGEFWQNVYSWMIMQASNAPTRSPWQLRRTEFWVSADAFILRHGRQEARLITGRSLNHQSPVSAVAPSQ